MPDNLEVLLRQLAPPNNESAPDRVNWGEREANITTKYRVNVTKVNWERKSIFLAEWNGFYGAGKNTEDAIFALGLKIKNRIVSFLLKEGE